MSDTLLVTNNGPVLTGTNFWQTPLNSRGLFYVSVNAGTFRVLVPDQHVLAVAEMQTAEFVSVKRYRDRVEIVFDDRSHSPYTLQLDVRQFDRLPSPADSGRKDLLCTVWVQGQDGLPRQVLSLPARYRDRR